MNAAIGNVESILEPALAHAIPGLVRDEIYVEPSPRKSGVFITVSKHVFDDDIGRAMACAITAADRSGECTFTNHKEIRSFHYIAKDKSQQNSEGAMQLLSNLDSEIIKQNFNKARTLQSQENTQSKEWVKRNELSKNQRGSSIAG